MDPEGREGREGGERGEAMGRGESALRSGPAPSTVPAACLAFPSICISYQQHDSAIPLHNPGTDRQDGEHQQAAHPATERVHKAFVSLCCEQSRKHPANPAHMLASFCTPTCPTSI